MSAPAIGSRWRLADGSGTTPVTVVRLELHSVLVEYADRENRWGGLERAWLPLALWTHGGTRVVADATPTWIDCDARRLRAAERTDR